MKTFTVTENCNLKDFTDFVFPQGAFCLAQLLKNKDIKINGMRTGENCPLNVGDTVVYYTTQKQEEKPSHAAIYEDENILVADKFSGVTSEGLLSELNGRGKYFAVHRLDRNTTGLLVFAKNVAAESELLSAFKEKRVVKTYIALCKNNFKKQTEVLQNFLLKDEKTSTVKIFKAETRGAVKIITEYNVLENRGDIALVKITLHTGKTHQIRAHMAYIGCPVLGDEKYGDAALNKKYNFKRQRLVSKTLEFCLSGSLSYLNGKQFVSCFEL